MTKSGSSDCLCPWFKNSACVEGGESGDEVKESEELDADEGGVGNQCGFEFNVAGLRPDWGELASDGLSANFSPRVVNESGPSLSMSWISFQCAFNMPEYLFSVTLEPVRKFYLVGRTHSRYQLLLLCTTPQAA